MMPTRSQRLGLSSTACAALVVCICIIRQCQEQAASSECFSTSGRRLRTIGARREIGVGLVPCVDAMTCDLASTGRRASFRAAVVFALVVAAGWPAPVGSQARPEYDLGAVGLLQALLRLQTTASVLHTGAHPDDEDSALIARLARGDHARVTYLSLNRGEG